MFVIQSLDHFVLTVQDIEKTAYFYQRALGMRLIEFGDHRKALVFGQQKINLHKAGHEFEPKAKSPLPGSADFCLITDSPIEQVIEHLATCNVPIEEGPIVRTGAVGPILSVYVRDPDEKSKGDRLGSGNLFSAFIEKSESSCQFQIKFKIIAACEQ
ncbi:Catechol 2,3-dioxygenase [Paenibacillus algorifonticola]|uniref:Catechol 2,3-dioxygenase n=1 Tax=Paenibacillus algorifonticola TaxID=684063 RepID=A0A1I1YZT1_9BACL|nr:VOC family protein [Paenibacillus algorifonticola]SFE25094.1 Catechol 2,3-dioxygenase [Paenibacillus algorifonticola]